jgi:integrase
VSASSQNQVFNALLFMFRNVLGKEFGKVDGIVRAKRKPYIPVVLSRKDCGLRISECISLRVHNFNFDMKILTIYDGKGN